jgi:hypothetical protein
MVGSNYKAARREVLEPRDFHTGNEPENETDEKAEEFMGGFLHIISW